MRVSTGSLDHGHDVRGARTTGNWADGTLLWQILTRISVPSQIKAVIPKLHDEMRACARPDDGVCSDCFEVEQGLRQGCVLSPPLLDIFFAAELIGAPEGTADVDKTGAG